MHSKATAFGKSIPKWSWLDGYWFGWFGWFNGRMISSMSIVIKRIFFKGIHLTLTLLKKNFSNASSWFWMQQTIFTVLDLFCSHWALMTQNLVNGHPNSKRNWKWLISNVYVYNVIMQIDGLFYLLKCRSFNYNSISSHDIQDIPLAVGLCVW